MQLKKLVIGIVVFGLAAFIWSKIIEYYVSSNTPDFLEQMEKDGMTSPHIRAKIGEQSGFESTYNENDLTTDTIKFKLRIDGANKSLVLKGNAVRKGADWKPIRIDSTYQDN